MSDRPCQLRSEVLLERISQQLDRLLARLAASQKRTSTPAMIEKTPRPAAPQ
jgi:hypothetical protein